MSTSIERRLNKLEEIRDRNNAGSDGVDVLLKKMGTSSAAMLADFGSLVAFRNWLAGETAATDHQEGTQPTDSRHRKWQGDSAVSAKWAAILDQYDALRTAAPGALSSNPKRNCHEQRT